MTACFAFIVASAFLATLVHGAEVGSIQNQLRSYLSKEMISTANAGYIPSAFVIPGTEVGPTGTFLASGGFSISNGYDSSCADSFATTSAAVDTCIVDGLFSYKLQLVKDSCAGAVVQYFFDDSCSLYSGSSELDESATRCNIGEENESGRPVYTQLSCGSETKAHLKEATVMDSILFAETLEPTAHPTQRPTQSVSAYPTAVTASTVTLSVVQVINGISFGTYTSHETADALTLKQTIAGCMDGVSVNDITKFTVTNANRRLSNKRALAGGAIRMSYTIVTSSKLTASQLAAQLTSNVDDGTFEDLLENNANNNNTSDFDGATSGEVEIVGEKSDARLGGGAIAAIVVGTVFGFILIVLALYLCIVGFGGESSSDDQGIHKAVEVTPPTEL